MSLSPILPQPRIGDAIRAEHIRALSDAVKKLTPCSSPTIAVRFTANGVFFDVVRDQQSQAARAPNDHNWTATIVDSKHLKISPSVVNTTYPTIGGTSILFSPQLTVSSSALQYICLKVVYSHTIVNGIITGGTITSATIAAYNSMPTSTSVASVRRLLSVSATTTTIWS